MYVQSSTVRVLWCIISKGIHITRCNVVSYRCIRYMYISCVPNVHVGCVHTRVVQLDMYHIHVMYLFIKYVIFS